jgi:hypothetical protein
MVTLAKVIFVEAKGEDHGKWLLLDFRGALLAKVSVEVSDPQGIIAALSQMKKECGTRFPNARLYPRSAVEYLVIQ